MYQPSHTATMTFKDYLIRHVAWGYEMFGTPADGRGPKGPLDHLKKEIKEIEADPYDQKEWIDAIILSIDGYIRAGGNIDGVLYDLFVKQEKNFTRKWPDWRLQHPDKAVEHVRGIND